MITSDPGPGLFGIQACGIALALQVSLWTVWYTLIKLSILVGWCSTFPLNEVRIKRDSTKIYAKRVTIFGKPNACIPLCVNNIVYRTSG